MANTTEFDLQMLTLGRTTSAQRRYVCALRNTEKRLYAWRYLAWLLDGLQDGAEPEYPATLSYMAAQAVRHTLDSLLN